MNKNYRIHTDIIKDSLLQVNMRQDFDFMEILSLKLSQRDAYKIHSSNYGVIIGRVLANDAFGIPNAKVSVFIERDNNDTTELENIYPYSDINGRDKEGRRYNLLPDYSDDECYRIVGTFPNKRLLLDDSTYLEVYDKYWKYSTVTNNAGDYMIFGVPVGNQQIHVDIDMSDIGVLSQKPRDYIYKGYTESLFDSSTQFKSSTNLDNLTQIFSQNKSVYVYPFWGDAENGIAAITRADIQINYKFEPTCVFIGSIVSDNDGNAIDHRCGATLDSGRNNQLVAGEGTIEMIRKTQDGLVEEYPINGNRLIDSDGVWCYQIPMNLDFVGTDEYGNIVPTDNPKKGIPTRSQVRFRISKTETGGEGFSMHTAKYLVPMNPVLDEEKTVPTTKEESGQEVEKMYLFGSNTPQSCFRDLYWNNVYSVKNFIPKTQTASRAYSPYYNALKAGNIVDNQNPIPFNKLEIQMSFTYMFICLLYTLLVAIVTLINATVIVPLNFIIHILNIALDLISLFWSPPEIPYLPCIHLNVGPNSDNAIFFPGCDDRGKEPVDCPEDMPNCYKSSNNKRLMDLIQYSLSEEYDTVRLDLYQDWINGCLYMPLWFWKKSKKKKFLFFTIRSAKDEYCSCDREYDRLKTVHTCSIDYKDESLKAPLDRVPSDEKKWHRDRRKGIYFRNGLIKSVENNDGLKAYYYAGYQLSSNDKTPINDIKLIKHKFEIVRLFATDIILLGNLNESNIYGIPQLFNNLPSTTANIPPIATIQEDMDGAGENTDSDLDHDSSLAGKTITTGMDWGYDGAEDAPIYKNGLFMDLSCFSAATRSKTCINVERMAELGVNLDISYKMSYPKGGDLTYGVVSSDGFINKWELNDNNSRAMFATLNHVGFMPQDYQTDKGMYETQIMDNNTGYLIPKFKYTYPVDFDGRMEEIMRDYENGFAQSLTDTKDEAYITFRLGAEATDKNGKTPHGRKRHFYYTNGDDSYEMPLYNNSFYFYFGINKGNTAIDKFNKKFVAPCVNGSKKPFSIDITTQGKVECKCMYKDKEYRNPYIKINMDDIQTPFSYELIDANNNKVVEENSKTLTEFKIPDSANKDTSGVVITNQVYTLKVTDANGKKLSERINVETPKVSIDYETQKLGTKFYNITETRVDNICSDKTMFYGILRIKSFTIDGYQFNISAIEPIGYDETTNSYIVRLTGISELTDVFYNGEANLDGDECASERPNKENLNQVIIYVSTLENKTSEVSTATTNGVRNCLCDKQNPVAVEQHSVSGIDIKASITTSKCWLGHKYVIPAIDNSKYYNNYDGDGGAKSAIDEYNEGKKESDKLSYNEIYEVAEFYAYQPNTFILTISQWCNGQIVSSNTVSETAIVQNGENFNAYLNKMPIRFMLGTLNDSEDGAIMNKSNFYRTEVVTNPNNDGLNGWFGVHEEDTYKFAITDDKNRSVWSDYVTLNTNISSNSAKKTILKFKFEAMFSVADATYVTANSSLKYWYRAEGGVGVPLNRLLAPEYDYAKLNGDNDSIYKYSDRSSVTCDSSYPNIVGNNYKGYGACDGDYGPLFNMYMCNDCIDSWLDDCDKDYDDCELCTLQGNYFAAFSNNGGYINTKTIDEDVPVSKIPTLAKVSVTTPTKTLGKDIKGIVINNVDSVYNKKDDSLPYFRAMFVDRRLDFDLNILAPSSGNFIRLYESAQEEKDEKIVYVPSPKENVWRGSRISGTTYGGIEMSYYDDSYDSKYSDISASTEEYEILTAKYNEDSSSAERNKILEYSISYSNTPGEDAITHFNKKPEIPRRLYEAELNGVDIRKFFWSNSRKEDLKNFVTGETNSLSNGEIYFYKYPKDINGLYNDDFMRDTVTISEEYGNTSSYPTKRYIDAGNLPMIGGYSNLLLVSCGYNMSPKIDSISGELKIKAVKGEKIDLDFNFQAPITMVTPNSENETFGNITYKFDNGFSGDLGWIHVKAELATMMFKINMYECEGFKVYNYTPRIIRVLPYIDGIDGISYYKTVTSTGNEDDTYKATGSLASAIEDVTIHMFEDIAGDSLFDILLNRGDIFSSEHIEFNNWYYNNLGGTTGGNFLAKGDTGDNPQILMSNETIWNNITFDKTFGLDNTQIFTVLLERNFEPTKKENLTKHIHTVETSSLFDARPLVFQIDENYTYVEMIPVAVETKISEEGSEQPPTADSTGQSHIQTIGFKFRFKKNAIPTESNCEAFGDYKSMSYKFIFTNGEGDKFTLNSSEIESEEDNENTYVSIKVKWTQDMGIAYDNEWQNGISLTILAKTRDNFIYKITDLTYAFGGFVDSDVSYNPETKKSNMKPNQPYKCNINFLP